MALATPVTMEEEEKMLGGSEAREIEASKVEIIIQFVIHCLQNRNFHSTLHCIALMV